ncbi:Zn-dependent peptidase ImmA (M78 family) [Hydrogenoanaerobacterium saccharovorans]|uniref:Zn-dependent peptidase ImmA, M78 family n=1 Tax=Hydrogenoanaerobacterium saccharovorans TaxID=474960 RepID=A0A1H7YLK0_9FIRM|nr:ImmA/IrrE family metallo-endopeptidase [Hydrogenoanaerobacterium saccharovorans]RPF41934.1 Zn-dependent peptidase ImmA (M78 family) [Hydrogenoanaerobacterium saccharovorans]SEM46177.1 Zn-dependent peptidase ImmA, M78 family [Hydrogenoanaerobacterium saccharovorans]
MTNNQIEQKANEVLAAYLKKGGSHKIFAEIMQDEGIKYREVLSENQNFAGALTKGNSGQVYVMVNKSIENAGRKNFTIAHELGHYFLGHQLKTNYFFCLDSQISEESIATNDIEHEANYFASCFLMPEDKVRKAFFSMLKNSRKAKIKDFLHVKNDYTFSIWCGIRGDLMKRYGVSEAALRYRLKQLGLARFNF